jgi:hypothetical protein
MMEGSCGDELLERDENVQQPGRLVGSLRARLVGEADAQDQDEDDGQVSSGPPPGKFRADGPEWRKDWYTVARNKWHAWHENWGARLFLKTEPWEILEYPLGPGPPRPPTPPRWGWGGPNYDTVTPFGAGVPTVSVVEEAIGDDVGDLPQETVCA